MDVDCTGFATGAVVAAAWGADVAAGAVVAADDPQANRKAKILAITINRNPGLVYEES